jgi:photosynthesis system II assembly factor YCF48-like protein/putative zinc finger protein
MPELPNLLRQRLAATETGETQAHPDADTLTAYMEHSLAPAESKTVIAHLAVCEPCREVVALSQAVMTQPETQIVIAPASVARWRRLFTPAFGAAASVAAMAVIAFMVLQLPHKNPQQGSNSPTTNGATANSPASQPAQETQQAKATSIGDQAAPAEPKAAAPIQQADTRVTSARSDLAMTARETEARLDDSGKAKTAKKLASPAPSTAAMQSSANVPVLTAALPKKDYVNTNFFSASGADKIAVDGQGNNLPAAPQPQPSATNTAFNTANNKITIFADLPTNAAGKSTVRLLTPPPPPEHLGCTVCKIVQSTAHTLGFHAPVRSPALRAGALSSSALGGPGMFSGAIEKNQPAEISAAPARADTDSFAASSSLSAGAMAYRSADSTIPTWKVADGKLMKSSGQAQWEDAYPVAGSTMEFSFVNARGNDVWAGGSHASLIHSRDGGQTWETVKLGDNASGTIVSIIAGTMSVQVKTSDNQSWSSTDGGKSWTLRE